MRSSFASRRKAKKIGGDDEEDEHTTHTVTKIKDGDVEPPLHPGTASSAKPKKKSSLRLSFGPGQDETDATTGSEADVFTPKKSNLSRQSIEKNALRKSLAASISSERLPVRSGSGEDSRPSYSKDYLDELRSSTPSTPKDLKSQDPVTELQNKQLDIAAKFGTYTTQEEGSIIPTEAEIREKKERRARLAKEQDYVSLDDEAGSGEIMLLPRKKQQETRLVRDDEDFAEGFDEFVEDGRVALGRKAEREEHRRRRAQMEEMIEDAEGSSDEDSDQSDRERRDAYEAAQTRAGTYAERKDGFKESSRPRTPPRITSLPTLGAVLERLQNALNSMEYTKMQQVRKLEEIRQDKKEIASREEDIQKLLEVAGENYEKLRLEAGLGGAQSGTSLQGAQDGLQRGQFAIDRGLESFGTPVAGSPRDG